MGVHKLIMLNPPTLDYVHIENVSELVRLPEANFYMRLSHPQGDFTSAVSVNISNQVIFKLL